MPRPLSVIRVLTTALAVALTQGSPAEALEVDVTLTLPQANAAVNRIDLTAASGTFSGSDTTDLSGNIEARLELDPLTLGVVATGIRFASSSLAATDVQINAPDFLTELTVSSLGLGGELATTIPGFSPVSLGNFSTADHSLNLNHGTVSLAGLANEVIDLATDPVRLADEDTASLSLTVISTVGDTLTYGVIVELPIDATTVLLESPEATLRALGNLRAVGSFEYTPPMPGDFNFDGRVDAADYTVWRNGFAANERPLSEYAMWRANYGVPQSSVASSSVPEPASPLLLVIASLMLGARKH